MRDAICTVRLFKNLIHLDSQDAFCLWVLYRAEALLLH